LKTKAATAAAAAATTSASNSSPATLCVVKGAGAEVAAGQGEASGKKAVGWFLAREKRTASRKTPEHLPVVPYQ
jgi:hypothetical protein